MDAYKINSVVIIFFSLFVFSCSQKKSVSSVFPDTQGTASVCGQKTSENRFIVEWESGAFSVEEDINSENFKKNFIEKKLHLIKHVDRDVTVKFLSHSDQINSQAVDTLNWGQSLIHADELWNENIKGQGIIIGVIDGMVDASHPLLKSHILVNPDDIANNNVDDDGNGFIDDTYGMQFNSEKNDPTKNIHGSHVSGIIIADHSQNSVKGVAPEAKVVPAQFMNNEGAGSIGDAIKAMNYAVSRGARILNLSWGAGPCVEIPSLKSALQNLASQGILIVTASGNGDDYGVGYNVDVYPFYPSSYNLSTQINVAATTNDDYMIGFSNYGAKTVHVAAPGVKIYSAIPNNGLESMSGTSMASPMTAGAAALIWSAFPQATALQVKQALLQSVDIIPGRNLEVSSRGRIQAKNAYLQLKKILGL